MSKALRYIGIARKAGKLVFGTQMVCDTLRRGGKFTVFAANDASEATMKKLTDKTTFYGVGLTVLGITSAELGHSIGKTGAVAAVYVDDEGLSLAADKAAKEQ